MHFREISIYERVIQKNRYSLEEFRINITSRAKIHFAVLCEV
jgi:hypothetical protein